MTSRPTLAAAAIAIGLVGLPVMAQPGTDKIGVAAAVRNDVKGILGQDQRALASGSPVYRDEVVRTGDKGIAQLLFADQTTISMGPKSELKLDKFVYNPSQNVGNVAFEFARGAMRFVSGAQDPRSYSIKTPVATIGVRGTIVDFLLVDNKLVAILDEGKALFTLPDGRVLELNEPGQSYEFLSGGGVTGPAPWTGRYETGLRVASFPLYGNAYADFPQFEGAPPPQGDATDLTEQLAALRQQFVPEPPAPPIVTPELPLPQEVTSEPSTPPVVILEPPSPPIVIPEPPSPPDTGEGGEESEGHEHESSEGHH